MSMSLWDHVEAIMNYYTVPTRNVKEALEHMVESLNEEEKHNSKHAVACGELASKLTNLLDNFGYW